MQFIMFLSMVLFTAFAAAQNPFSFVSLPQSIPVGSPFNITWSPSTGTVDTVTLILRQGDANDLATIQTIACTYSSPPSSPCPRLKIPKPNPDCPANIQNTGSYLWTPSPSLVNGPLYAFQIVDDGNTDIVNYSGLFAISSPNTSTASPSSQSETGSSATSTGASTSTEAKTSVLSGTKSSASTQTSPPASAATGESVSSLNTGGATMVGVGCGSMLVLVAGIMIGM